MSAVSSGAAGPAVPPAPQPTSEGPLYYISRQGETYGPSSSADLAGLVESGWLGPDDLVWTEGLEQWVAVADLVFESGAEAAGENGPPEEMPASSVVPGPAGGTAAEPSAASHEIEEPAHAASPAAAPALPTFARYHSRSVSRVFAGGTGSLVTHISLFILISAATFYYFERRVEVASAPVAPEDKPMEITMVEEPPPAPPPPPEPPPPQPEPPPPPPPEPPPPPAPVEMPHEAPPPPPPEPAPPAPAPPVPAPEPEPAPAPKPVPPPKPRPVVKARPPEPEPPVENTVRDVGPTDYLEAPTPQYPPRARLMRLQGTVMLRVAIDEAGRPVSVSMEESSGASLLDHAAQSWVAQHFRFTTGQAKTLRVPVTYRLEN